MKKVNISELKTNLSTYLKMIESGKEEKIIICRYGKEIAKMVLYDECSKTKRIGAAKNELNNMPFSLEDPDGEMAKSFGY